MAFVMLGAGSAAGEGQRVKIGVLRPSASGEKVWVVDPSFPEEALRASLLSTVAPGCLMAGIAPAPVRGKPATAPAVVR